MATLYVNKRNRYLRELLIYAGLTTVQEIKTIAFDFEGKLFTYRAFLVKRVMDLTKSKQRKAFLQKKLDALHKKSVPGKEELSLDEVDLDISAFE